MIESFVPGRVRLRSRLLADPAAAALFKGRLLDVRGVRAVSVNARSGGLLLEYDTRQLPLSLLSKALPLFDRLRALEGGERRDVLSNVDAILKELKSLLESASA